MKRGSLALAGVATVFAEFMSEMAIATEPIMDEVVVTARRREENLQRVPVAVTLIDKQILAERGITSNQDLRFVAPSLISTNLGGSGMIEAGYIIRGQGPGAGSSNVGGVVTYFAEVPTHLTSMPYYDIASVQVLNGPQGTLFGRNTTGGAVLISPQAPTPHVEGYVRTQLGNYGYRELEGVLNVPLVQDKVLLRIAGDAVRRDGYLQEVNTGRDLLDKRGQFLRLTLKVSPNDRMDNTLIHDRVTIDTHGGGLLLKSYRSGSPADLTFGPLLAPLFGGQTLANAFSRQQSMGKNRASIDQRTREQRDIRTFVNTTHFDVGDTLLGALSLKNIISYRHNDVEAARDFDGTSLPIVGASNFNEYGKYITEEFQLVGRSFNDRLRWVVGYYVDRNDEEDPDENQSVQIFFGIPGAPGWPLTIYSLEDESSEAYFTQGSYALTDQLQLTLGVRYTQDEREVKSRHFVGPDRICALSDPEPGCVHHASGDWDATTWTVSVDYQLAPQALLYAASRRGYKAGAFNADIDPASPYYLVEPETVTDLELGGKFEWRQGRIDNRTNVAVYYSRYQDIQRNISTVVDGVLSTLTRNAAEARIEGFELTHSSYIGASFEVDLMYAYTDAEFTAVDDPMLLAASGGQLAGVPTSKGSLTLRYQLPLSAALGSASIGVTGNYSTRWNWVDTIGDEPDGYAPEVTTFDGRAEWRNIMNSNLSIGVFVRNATDERYAIGGTALSSTVGTTSALYSEPRSYGLDLQYAFGQR